MAKTLPYCIIFSFLFLSLGTIEQALARRNTLSAGITTAYDYSETSYDNDATDNATLTRSGNRLKKVSIGPIFLFDTKSSRNNLSLRYNPNFAYDYERQNNVTDQDLNITADHNFTKTFHATLRNHFLYSDDPELVNNTNNTDFNRGRRRYWKNDFNMASTYNYNRSNSIGGGYSLRILRNEDTGPGGYENYDKHVADISLKHHFNARWLLGVTGSYTRGLFDPPDEQIVSSIAEGLSYLTSEIPDTGAPGTLSNDLSKYRAGLSVDWTLDPRKTLVSSYDFSGTVYDAILRKNTNLHTLTFSGRYQYSKYLSLALGGGPSYEKTEGFSGNLDYNVHLDISYKPAKLSTFTAAVEKGYDQQNFSSNNNGLGRDQGLTDFWDWQLDFSHELIKDLRTTLFVSYRNERQENLLHGVVNTLESGTFSGTDNAETFRQHSIFSRDIYRAGGSVSYSFVKYWTSAIKYSYRKQQSQRINDSFDEHRLFLTLTVQKEILRW
jgi:hypothetical protein